MPSRADELRSEQLLDVRRADRPVVGGAEADVAGRSELGRQLVGVGVVLAAVAELVPGPAIAGAERQVVDEVVLDDRDLGFAEEFDHPEAAVDRKRRSALTGEIAGLERLVRIQASCSLRYSAPTLMPTPSSAQGSLTPISPSAPVKLAWAICSESALMHAEDVEIIDRCLRRTESPKTS